MGHRPADTVFIVTVVQITNQQVAHVEDETDCNQSISVQRVQKDERTADGEQRMVSVPAVIEQQHRDAGANDVEVIVEFGQWIDMATVHKGERITCTNEMGMVFAIRFGCYLY